MKRFLERSALAIVATASFLITTPAQATILSGTFTTAGLGDVRVGVDFINWGEVGPDFSTPIGDIIFPNGSGDFAVLGGATQGTIKDLSSATEPVDTPLALHNFITAATQPTWDFVLTRILPGGSADSTCDDVSGTVCTPLGTPFTITNTSAQTADVGVVFLGYVTDGSGDPVSPFIASFTTSVPNTGGEILAQILSVGYYQTSHAGTFTVTAGDEPAIPEPSTMVLMGGGLIGLGLVARKRKASV